MAASGEAFSRVYRLLRELGKRQFGPCSMKYVRKLGLQGNKDRLVVRAQEAPEVACGTKLFRAIRERLARAYFPNTHFLG